MSSTDFLAPFVEVSRAMCDGADSYTVMHLIARRITETLGLKGCFIKLKAESGDLLEMVSSYGFTEHFLFFDPKRAPDGLCFRLPDALICFPRLEDETVTPEQEAMMIEGIRAGAVVPIEIEREVVAMVGLFASAPREFTRTEISFAEALAGGGILSILSDRRLQQNIERESQYLKSFQEISSTINSTLNIGQVLDLVVTKVTQALGGKGTTVRLLDPKTHHLYLANSYGLSKQYLDKGPVDSQRSIAENLAGRTVVVDDVFSDPRLQYPAETAEEGIRKLLSIPLLVRGKVIGVLRVYTGERPPFTERELNFAAIVAQQCALAIENARIYQRVKYEYQQLLIEFGYNGSSQ